MSNDAAAMANSINKSQKANYGAQIVSKTLDAVNKTTQKSKSKSSGGDMTATYEMSKAVLSAAFSPKGTITETKS